MVTFVILFKRMIALLFMMACGYLAYKKNWVSDKGFGELSKIVADVLNPFLIMNAVLTADTGITMNLIAQNVALVALYFGVLIILGWILPFLFSGKKQERAQYNMMIVFSNVGFMAIPVLSAIYSEAATIYIVFYILGFNLIVYTYGIFICGKTKSCGTARFDLKKLMNPGFIASILAILLFLSGIKLGDPFTTVCGYMGNACVPLSMFLIGVSIAMFPMKEFISDKKVYLFALFKLLIIPILFALIMKQVPMDEMVKVVFIYELAMPAGSLVLAFVKNYGENEIVSSRGIVITTVLSLFTIPMVAFFL